MVLRFNLQGYSKDRTTIVDWFTVLRNAKKSTLDERIETGEQHCVVMDRTRNLGWNFDPTNGRETCSNYAFSGIRNRSSNLRAK